jgi:hypothetical protein
LWTALRISSSQEKTMTVTLTAPIPGDNCGAPLALAFTGGADGGDVKIKGDTTFLFRDSTPSCAPSNSGDAVYTFTTGRVLDLRVTVVGQQSMYPIVFLRDTCRLTPLGRELGCANAFVDTAQLTVGSLSPGRYYLWVASKPYGNGGPFDLSATLTTPVQGDTCLNPLPLPFTIAGADGGVSQGVTGGTANVQGDTSYLFDNTAGSCGGSGGNDAVYQFNTALPLNLTANISQDYGWKPILYLRQTSCDAGKELACSYASTPGGTASISVSSLPAGSYFLWVDGLGGGAGSYTLRATLQ